MRLKTTVGGLKQLINEVLNAKRLTRAQMIGRVSQLDGYTIVKYMRSMRDSKGNFLNVYQVRNEDGSVAEDQIHVSGQTEEWFPEMNSDMARKHASERQIRNQKMQAFREASTKWSAAVRKTLNDMKLAFYEKDNPEFCLKKAKLDDHVLVTLKSVLGNTASVKWNQFGCLGYPDSEPGKSSGGWVIEPSRAWRTNFI